MSAPAGSDLRFALHVERRFDGRWMAVDPPPGSDSWTGTLAGIGDGIGNGIGDGARVGAVRMHELEIALGIHGGIAGMGGVLFPSRGLPVDLSQGLCREVVLGTRGNWIRPDEVIEGRASHRDGWIPLRRCDVWMGTDEERDPTADPDPGEETFCAWATRGGGRPRSWSSFVAPLGVSLLSEGEAMRMVIGGGVSDRSTGRIMRDVDPRMSVSTSWAYVRVSWIERLEEQWPSLIDGVERHVRPIADPDDVRIVAMRHR